jgi:hypothetical protein
MKQGDLYGMRRARAECFSGGQFRFAVESLDNSRRDRAPSPQPVDDQVPMTPQAPGDLLHRADPAPHGAEAPGVEELHRPLWARVPPEPHEVLAEQMRPDALEVVRQDLLELDLLMLREVLRSRGQAPPSLGQDRLVTVSSKLGARGTPDLIESHFHVPHDMEAVEHKEGSWNLLGDHVGIGLPHVAADEADIRARLGGKRREKSAQALFRSLLGDPEQPLYLIVLVNERELGVAVAALNLVDKDRFDAREAAVGKAPFDRVFYGATHVVPYRVAGVSRLLPRQPLGQAGQEPAVTCRELTLAFAPRHPLDRHAALWAVYPPHRVNEEHRDVPEWNELESARFKPVIAGPLLAAARADRPAVGPGRDIDLDLLVNRIVDEADVLVDETLVPLDAVENTLEMHPAEAPAKGLTKQPHLYRTTRQDAFSLLGPPVSAVLPDGGTPPHCRRRPEVAGRIGSPRRRCPARYGLRHYVPRACHTTR